MLADFCATVFVLAVIYHASRPKRYCDKCWVDLRVKELIDNGKRINDER